MPGYGPTKMDVLTGDTVSPQLSEKDVRLPFSCGMGDDDADRDNSVEGLSLDFALLNMLGHSRFVADSSQETDIFC